MGTRVCIYPRGFAKVDKLSAPVWAIYPRDHKCYTFQSNAEHHDAVLGFKHPTTVLQTCSRCPNIP